MSQIRDLVVFRRLSVRDLKVEPKRVRARYVVTHADGHEESTELMYSYNQPYFDPKDPGDVNLASMMVAQVALNYGLFCEEMYFEGLYESVDRRFLEDMLENTSREIFVNKFLFPNEFLTEPFRNIEPVQLPRYTAAKLVWSQQGWEHLTLKKGNREVDMNQYAILSSGGKDSLLTYGLAKELGEAHPVFVNESGRHWFTAVNAYEHFAQIEPNTAKPWCNSDRLFNWMLRQMPFIKPNFANIRADMYPIRLWTVAVFLFGVLPVARKRGVGNILIGNEYDSTQRGNHQGISHYHSLYDQSKYFDNAFTRYYRKKGWNFYQYSMLRSLSELLILKVLVKRYPDLQQHQVSCHAAHEREGRMYPCGKCEKCRRIIGMLKALDEDPARCGYTEQQVEQGLAALAQKSVKQIGTDAAHLYHLLLDKGLLPTNEHTRKLARAYPQILKLRFDQERSQIMDLPEHVRQPLLALLEPYADGYARTQQGKWTDFMPSGDWWSTPYFLAQQNG